MKLAAFLLSACHFLVTAVVALNDTIGTDEWRFGTNLADRSYNVGDTVTFEWTGTHNVYIHPSGDCSTDGAIEVGETSPTSYTFTAVGNVTFACDVPNHCQDGGMILKTTVAEANGGTPTAGETPPTAPSMPSAGPPTASPPSAGPPTGSPPTANAPSGVIDTFAGYALSATVLALTVIIC